MYGVHLVHADSLEGSEEQHIGAERGAYRGDGKSGRHWSQIESNLLQQSSTSNPITTPTSLLRRRITASSLHSDPVLSHAAGRRSHGQLR